MFSLIRKKTSFFTQMFTWLMKTNIHFIFLLNMQRDIHWHFGIVGQVGRHLKASVFDELGVTLKNQQSYWQEL